eukprot:GHUV01004096.1.p1 GENE.GHUV01004096.1~~GHUV01004096.1.p1  ORF type:complete len:263 (+),score=88.77 GHUV01004096.1:55-843(+)
MQARSAVVSNATRPATAGLVRVRPCNHTLCVVPVRRNVRVNFREGSKQEDQISSTTNRWNSGYRGYSTGYDDDPSASLRDGWNRLVEKWQEWPAEERNPTLALGAGALAVLYVANAVLDAIERVPLIPPALKLVGFGFSTWFFYRYILYAEGRQDLARDLTIENITGRTPQQIKDSVNRGSRGSRMDDRADVDNLQDMARRASAAMDEPLSSGKPSASERGYGQGGSSSSSSGSKAADGVANALHDFDQLADELTPDSGKKW